MKTFAFTLIALASLVTSAHAQDSATYYNGKTKASVELSVINNDGYEKKIISGGPIAKLFGNSIAFEVTPSGNQYITIKKGSKAEQKQTASGYSFKQDVDYYTVSWDFKATLSAENVQDMILTACSKLCQKRHPEVKAALQALTGSSQTFPISSHFYKFSGETTGEVDTSELDYDFTLPAGDNSQLKITLCFPKYWKIQ